MRASLALLAAALASVSTSDASPSFVVANDRFELNGAPFTIRSGSLHYHRLRPEQWHDRLARMAAMGLNAVQTYVPWNWHERARGVFTFTGDADLELFLTTAASLNLLVLLRAGPYICGEHDFGGFPAYLLTTPNMTLRTNNSAYLTYVDRWWRALLPHVAPHTVAAGGNVALMQIENEYGSYGDTGGDAGDAAYMQHLASLARSLVNVTLYTTDGGDAGYLSHGTIGGVYATGDFGPTLTPQSAFTAQDQFNPSGQRAHTDSEYYTGWLTHWTEGMANTSSLDTAAGISVILSLGASFNLYMAYGGTNWGFHNGANGGGASISPVITSYDYNSPIEESGGHGYSSDGDKFVAIQQVLTYWTGGETFPPEPPLPPRTAYGALVLPDAAPVWSNLPALASGVFPAQSLGTYMEAYNVTQGFMLYRQTAPAWATGGSAATFTFSEVSDRVQLFVNGVEQGNTIRGNLANIVVPANVMTPGAVIDLLVENMGHINYGHGMFDPKGLLGTLTINSRALNDGWTLYGLPFDYTLAANATFAPTAGGAAGPILYRGNLNIAGTPADTFIAPCGWTKGFIYVNGFNIGRYWQTAGPQYDLYIPACLLQSGNNEIIIAELHAAPANASVLFVDVPDFNGAVCTGAAAPTRDAPIAAPVVVAAARALQTCPDPYQGQDISLQTCGSGKGSAFMFDYTVPAAMAGRLQSTAVPSLCVVVNGTNPTTGYPNLALGACAAGDRTQEFMHFQALTGGIMSVTNGMFFDLVDGYDTVGTRVELYPNNGGSADQRFAYSASSGYLTHIASGLCVTAC